MRPDLEEIEDPWTGEWFVPGRSNQKFANTQNQKDYNNDKNKKKRKEMEKFEKPLRENGKILDRVMKDRQELTIPKIALTIYGFNLGMFHGVTTIDGSKKFVIQNYAITILPDEMIKITRL